MHSATPAPAADASRLPMVWYYDEDEEEFDEEETMRKTYRSLREQGRLLPGDIIAQRDKYRDNDTWMVSESLETERLPQNGRGHGFLPPRAIAWGIERGFALHELVETYKDHVSFILYPRGFQGPEDLVIRDKTLVQARGYDSVYAESECLLNDDPYDHYELYELPDADTLFAVPPPRAA